MFLRKYGIFITEHIWDMRSLVDPAFFLLLFVLGLLHTSRRER